MVYSNSLDFALLKILYSILSISTPINKKEHSPYLKYLLIKIIKIKIE